MLDYRFYYRLIHFLKLTNKCSWKILSHFSVLIEGPKNTPYEDGLFAFDLQLGHDYPRTPPLCHYISYCSDRLNPNLYEDGKVCVSLLGTWSGKGTEVWTSASNLLQVIVSLQGLILVDEPYFNEAGYEKQRGELIFFYFCCLFIENMIFSIISLNLSILLVCQMPIDLHSNWKILQF